MLHKISILPFIMILLLFCSRPAAADIKVEMDTQLGWNSAVSDLPWDAGFITDGNWSLGSNLAFFLKDQLHIDQADQQWQGTLDRCYLRYEQGAARFNLGRQGVTWGIGWFFRPTDIITPLTPLAEEETRPGKDLAALRLATSPLTATDLIAGDQVYAARTEWRIGPTNLRLLGVYQPQYVNAVGVDFQGGLAGLYGEGVFRWAAATAVDQGRFAGLIGWRKTVKGSQFSMEYYRNGLSEASGALADLLAENRNHELLYENRNYLAAGIEIPWDQLTTVSVTAISNLDDGGSIVTGTASWQLSDNLDLKGTIMTVAGSEGTEFYRGSRVTALVEMKYYF